MPTEAPGVPPTIRAPDELGEGTLGFTFLPGKMPAKVPCLKQDMAGQFSTRAPSPRRSGAGNSGGRRPAGRPMPALPPAICGGIRREFGVPVAGQLPGQFVDKPAVSRITNHRYPRSDRIGNHSRGDQDARRRGANVVEPAHLHSNLGRGFLVALHELF